MHLISEDFYGILKLNEILSKSLPFESIYFLFDILYSRSLR